jgi:hypothetical protein
LNKKRRIENSDRAQSRRNPEAKSRFGSYAQKRNEAQIWRNPQHTPYVKIDFFIEINKVHMKHKFRF